MLKEFDGEIGPTEVRCPFNISRNLTKYVIDSEGKVWVFNHTGHDKKGVRAAVVFAWNFAHDFYSYKVECDKTVNWFKSLLEEYINVDDLDTADMAVALLESASTCRGEMRLSDVMDRLNL